MDKKKRTDRNHVIYQLTCVPTGDLYIGLTVARGRAFIKSAMTRFQQHCYRAEVETDKDWALYETMREHDGWVVEVLEVVRGKSNAHARERELIAEIDPNLNSQ